MPIGGGEHEAPRADTLAAFERKTPDIWLIFSHRSPTGALYASIGCRREFYGIIPVLAETRPWLNG